MNLLFHFFQRAFIIVLNLFVLWFLVAQVFSRLTIELPFLFILVLAYILSTYVFLPRIIHFLVFVFRRNRIPRYTHAPDGILADPVNIVLFGTQKQLLHAFHEAEWHLSEPLNLRTGWKMGIAFVLNQPYKHAPFSSLYLFARRQDFGFQKMIGESPRKRHHVRFWAANIDTDIDILSVRFWLGKRTVDHNRPVMWIGAATKDIGFGFSRLTYRITHRIDSRVDEEREHIIDSLLSVRQITDINQLEANIPVIGTYISDGKISTAWLKN